MLLHTTDAESSESVCVLDEYACADIYANPNDWHDVTGFRGL